MEQPGGRRHVLRRPHRRAARRGVAGEPHGHSGSQASRRSHKPQGATGHYAGGRVFAAVKTSLDDLPNPNPNAPQIVLLVLGQDGEWSRHVFGTVGDHHSRPIVMLDEEHRELYMFATAPTGGGTIYYKRTDLDNISFPSGKGTPFIQSATDTHIDDATSTKQNLGSATGLAVLASDSQSKYYLHNAVEVDGGVHPRAAPSSAPRLARPSPAPQQTTSSAPGEATTP